MSDTIFQIAATIVLISGMLNLVYGWLGATIPPYSKGVESAVARFFISNTGRIFSLSVGFLTGIIGAIILFQYLNLQVIGVVEVGLPIVILVSGMVDIAVTFYDSYKPLDRLVRTLCTILGLVTGFIGLMLLFMAIFGYI